MTVKLIAALAALSAAGCNYEGWYDDSQEYSGTLTLVGTRQFAPTPLPASSPAPEQDPTAVPVPVGGEAKVTIASRVHRDQDDNVDHNERTLTLTQDLSDYRWDFPPMSDTIVKDYFVAAMQPPTAYPQASPTLHQQSHPMMYSAADTLLKSWSTTSSSRSGCRDGDSKRVTTTYRKYRRDLHLYWGAPASAAELFEAVAEFRGSREHTTSSKSSSGCR